MTHHTDVTTPEGFADFVAGYSTLPTWLREMAGRVRRPAGVTATAALEAQAALRDLDSRIFYAVSSLQALVEAAKLCREDAPAAVMTKQFRPHTRTCPAYGNYQPPYEECTCGADAARADDEAAALLARIRSYFDNGGVFNPEMMDHDIVRELLMDCERFIKS